MIDEVELLRDLVRIPSVNPRLSGVKPDHAGEERIARHLAELLSANGFTVETPAVFPGRPNVIAYRPGVGARALGLSAHLDTMPIDEGASRQLEGDIKDGRLWGRGSADTKGSIAAMVTAAVNVTAEKADDLPSILLVFTCDEENGFGGMRHFASSPGWPLAGLVIGEPTAGQLIMAHKGVCRCNIQSRGVAAHSAFLEKGVNAIYRMIPVVRQLQNLATRLMEEEAHPELGHKTLSVGTINGGNAVNTVPESCAIEVDRRLLPGEKPDQVMAEIHTMLDGLDGVEVEDPYLFVPGFKIDATHPWATYVSTSLGIAHGDAVAYATDASLCHTHGIPCVVYGPGDPAAAHSRDESISLEALRNVTDQFRTLIRNGTQVCAGG